MNENNALNISEGSRGRIVELSEKFKGKNGKNLTVFIPTIKKLANARVLDVNSDGSLSIHWERNWNTSGDFRTELMQFNNNLIMDNLDLEERNKIRRKAGLVEIE